MIISCESRKGTRPSLGRKEGEELLITLCVRDSKPRFGATRTVGDGRSGLHIVRALQERNVDDVVDRPVILAEEVAAYWDPDARKASFHQQLQNCTVVDAAAICATR